MARPEAGNCYSVQTSSGFRGIVCTAYFTDTRPHGCSFAPVSFKCTNVPTLSDFQQSNFWGERRKLDEVEAVLSERPELKRLWKEFPWKYGLNYDLGLYQINIPNKSWRGIEDEFVFCGNLPCDKALLRSACAGIYIETIAFMLEFLANLEFRMSELSLENIPVQALVTDVTAFGNKSD